MEDNELKDFTIEVERFLSENVDISPIDAVLHLAEMYDLEVETVAKLVKGPLKQKVLLDAKNSRMMKDNSVEPSINDIT